MTARPDIRRGVTGTPRSRTVVDRDRPIRSGQLKDFAVETINDGVSRATNPCGILGDNVQHRLDVGR